MSFSATGDVTGITVTNKGGDTYDLSFNPVSGADVYGLTLVKITSITDETYITEYAITGISEPLSSNLPFTIYMPGLATYSGVTPGVYRIKLRARTNAGVDIGTEGLSDSSNLIVYNVGGGSGGAVCFLGSAPVLTPTGWARIDSLAVGDMVRTADGRDVAIQRVKHQRIEAPSAAVNPYVILEGQWGATENLAISPRHCVAVPGRGMVEARELGLKQMPMRAAFDYYNLELPEWDNMVVAGVEVESLAPRKRVAMTVEQLACLLATVPAEKRAAVLAKRVTAMADGKVTVEMSRKERRMR